MPELRTLAELAQELGCTVEALRAKRSRPGFPAPIGNGRPARFDAAAVRAWYRASITRGSVVAAMATPRQQPTKPTPAAAPQFDVAGLEETAFAAITATVPDAWDLDLQRYLPDGSADLLLRVAVNWNPASAVNAPQAVAGVVRDLVQQGHPIRGFTLEYFGVCK